MAVVYRCVGILTVLCCRLLLKSWHLPFSGFLPLDVLSPAVGDIFSIGRCRCVRCREPWACPSRLLLIYVVHAYCSYVIGQHSDNWNLIGRFLYHCFLWSEVLLCTFFMQDTKFYVFLSLPVEIIFMFVDFYGFTMQPRIIMLRITYNFGVIKCNLVFGVLHHMLSNSRPFCIS